MKRFLVVIPFFLSVLFGACYTPVGTIPPSIGTLVARTQTATMWTPIPVTPSATLVPNEAVILKALKDGLRQRTDPLVETLDAKFSIVDISFDQNGKLPIATMIVQVDCEWIKEPSCTKERAFVTLANAFAGIKDDVRKKMMKQIPKTIDVVQVRAFDHMTQIGIVEVSWECLLQFADGDITGEQLAARVVVFVSPVNSNKK